MATPKTTWECPQCKSHLKFPVLLPCGQSVCQSHVIGKDRVFFCASCNSNHLIPDGGFLPDNVAIESMRVEEEQQRAAKEKEAHFETEKEKALRSVRELQATLDQMTQLKNDPQTYISEVIGKLKRQVEEARNKLKKRIDDEADQVIGEINRYRTPN